MEPRVTSLQVRTEQHLEWDRLIEYVLDLCRGPSARRRGIRPSDDRQGALALLAQTREALAWRRAEERPPLAGLHDLASHVGRLQRGAALDGPALVEVRSVLDASRDLREFLSRRRVQSPHLYTRCGFDPTLDALGELLAGALRDDGSLEDGASPVLAKLRTETGNLRNRIIGRLDALIEKHRDLLQDNFFTLREGRYVVPVRHDAHERFPGIVHGASQSGASLFVEPRSIVEQGNRLKMAQAELEREEQRILAELSDAVRDRLAELSAACESIDVLDLACAHAEFGVRIDGVVPELSEDASILLTQARHPLLVLDGVDVVPNDLELRAGEGLIVSGPNAGGKTILLKTLGLFALMARAGLPIAAAPGSRIGCFAAVLTDMGDDQSTLRNLSTFSAHVTHVASILHRAAPDSLVLLDEPAGGTDPQEGAALACAIIDGLLERGAAIAASTHYEPLKAYSLEDPRLRCAAVGLDLADMRPSFHLMLDVPGRSSAFSVATRFGMPDAIVANAERMLPEATRRFESLLGELERRIEEQRVREQSLRDEVARQAQLRHELEARVAEQRTRGKARVDAESDALLVEIRGVREQLGRERERLRSERREESELREQARRVDRIAERVALGGDLSPTPEPTAGQPPAPEALRAGVSVRVPRLRADAVVVEAPQRGKVRVAVGAMKLWVGVDEVAQAEPRRDAPKAVPRPLESRAHTGRSPDNTLDVKGMRVDDALAMLESFVDRMYGSDQRVGYVLHGHGTGALRQAVREHLTNAMPHIERHLAASHDDGGDAVTVFYVR